MFIEWGSLCWTWIWSELDSLEHYIESVYLLDFHSTLSQCTFLHFLMNFYFYFLWVVFFLHLQDIEPPFSLKSLRGPVWTCFFADFCRLNFIKKVFLLTLLVVIFANSNDCYLWKWEILSKYRRNIVRSRLMQFYLQNQSIHLFFFFSREVYGPNKNMRMENK